MCVPVGCRSGVQPDWSPLVKHRHQRVVYAVLSGKKSVHDTR
ncbi:MAG: hypothetical protein KatS3mg054_0388 [Chloroflexus sp.]|nr:MAG: hypothetical protein KatS3mg054_0388 [Chloroflexus sp.]